MKLIHGDCLDKLKDLETNSIDSIVTDPPYELGFMGKSWDSTGIAYNIELWKECLRVLKPGGHLLAFSGTRTYHRMAVAIEDAGFEVRDMIEWVYGSGFPKSLNIEKQLIKQGYKEEAKQWKGYGTATKPSHEPICMARKPLAEKTVAENCLKWGTGGINIDESRVDGKINPKDYGRGGGFVFRGDSEDSPKPNPQGRFPANLIHDNSEEVTECFPETKTNSTGKNSPADYKTKSVFGAGYKSGVLPYSGDSGNASRFFKSIIYQAKPSNSEKNKGCEGLEFQTKIFRPGEGLGGKQIPAVKQNHHPTVKPIALMEYLIKMVTPKGGTVLDPFAGSGSTLVASKKNGYQYVGIEMTEEYISIIEARLNAVEEKPVTLF